MYRIGWSRAPPLSKAPSPRPKRPVRPPEDFSASPPYSSSSSPVVHSHVRLLFLPSTAYRAPPCSPQSARVFFFWRNRIIHHNITLRNVKEGRWTQTIMANYPRTAIRSAAQSRRGELMLTVWIALGRRGKKKKKTPLPIKSHRFSISPSLPPGSTSTVSGIQNSSFLGSPYEYSNKTL